MNTIQIISHTHWDREWYLTFQQFRLKLVHLVDGLLARGVNLGGEPVQVALRPWRLFGRAARANLAEEALEDMAVEVDGAVRFEAGGHQVVSVRFWD